MGEKIDIAALPLLLPPFVRIRLLLKLLIKTKGGGPPLPQCSVGGTLTLRDDDGPVAI